MEEINRANCKQNKIESYSQRVERSTDNKNNGNLNMAPTVRRTRKHGSKCEGRTHGIYKQSKSSARQKDKQGRGRRTRMSEEYPFI